MTVYRTVVVDAGRSEPSRCAVAVLGSPVASCRPACDVVVAPSTG